MRGVGERRVTTITRHVGLADVGPDARARLDGIARIVQDVSDYDAATVSIEGMGLWILRRLELRIAKTPRFRAEVVAQTWCSGIGARLKCVTRSPGETKPHQQIDEVRSGGSYISQNDLRVHFGLEKAEKVDLLEIRWPSGQTDTLKDVKPNQLVFVKEGEGAVRTMQFPAAQRKSGKQ